MIKYGKYYSLTRFFHVFFMCLSLLCRRGRGCAARRGRRPLQLLGHANTRSSFLLHLCLLILRMQELWNFFLQCSSLERASRSLAKTGFFLGLRGVFFFRLFSVWFLGVPEGTFDAHGALWGSFGSRLGVFLVTF